MNVAIFDALRGFSGFLKSHGHFCSRNISFIAEADLFQLFQYNVLEILLNDSYSLA